MGRVNLEVTDLKVPIGQSNMIGNTLRQFAMRGESSWQVAAYRAGAKGNGYGLSGNAHFSCLEFLKGELEAPPPLKSGEVKVCKFELVGNDYVCEDMQIHGLGNLGFPTIEACLVSAIGVRNAEENFEIVKSFASNDFIAVPSRHGKVVTFRFTTSPIDMSTECLHITSDAGAVSTALAAAVKVFSTLRCES